jgi:putative membrane protein
MMGFGFAGMLLMIFFWVTLITLGVWVVKALFSGGYVTSIHQDTLKPSARELLDQRYARGEIDREQYELMRHDIEGGTLP